MTDEQRAYVRENIFPYWKGKSVEDAFLARTSAETKKIGVDTGFVDTDSKWRNGIGEMSPDYVDQLFPKGFGGIKKEAEGYMAELNEAIPEEKDKLIFYRSIVLVCDGIVRLANRYAEKARERRSFWKLRQPVKPFPKIPRNLSARQSSSHGLYSWAALSLKTLWH